MKAESQQPTVASTPSAGFIYTLADHEDKGHHHWHIRIDGTNEIVHAGYESSEERRLERQIKRGLKLRKNGNTVLLLDEAIARLKEIRVEKDKQIDSSSLSSNQVSSPCNGLINLEGTKAYNSQKLG